MAMLPIRRSRTPDGRRNAKAAGLACFVLAFVAFAGPVSAQGPTVDTSLPAMPGNVGSSLGPAPGGGNSALGAQPGAGGTTPSANLPGGGVLGGRAGPYAPKGVPTSITTPGGGPVRRRLQMPVTGPQPQPVGATSAPFAGTLELTSSEPIGPPDGLTLEQAIDVTLKRSLDLRQKFIEIPMARADILQVEPAGESRLLPGRPAPAIPGQASTAAPGPAARSSSTPTSPIRSTSRSSARPARS